MRGVFTSKNRGVYLSSLGFLVVGEHDFCAVSVGDFAEKFVEGFIRSDGFAVDFVGSFVGGCESPMYLASKGKMEEAERALSFYSQVK